MNIGKRHPDPVVETASLASVLPPNVYYTLKLPKETINTGKLSALQLEAVVYACQQHDHILRNGERAGFLIGDGAGVGKGRTIAGIIYENYLCGRKKALWVSVSTDLKYDSERDLEDIGAKSLKVYPLNKLKYGKINLPDKSNKGVIFATYSSLIGESSQGGRFNTRLKQILEWCGKDFDGVVSLYLIRLNYTFSIDISKQFHLILIQSLYLLYSWFLTNVIVPKIFVPLATPSQPKRESPYMIYRRNYQKPGLYTHQLPEHLNHATWLT